VPEDYLGQKLTITTADQLRHSTLYEIASRKKQPVTRIVSTVQQAILTYRKEHPPIVYGLIALECCNEEPLLPVSGRMNG